MKVFAAVMTAILMCSVAHAQQQPVPHTFEIELGQKSYPGPSGLWVDEANPNVTGGIIVMRTEGPDIPVNGNQKQAVLKFGALQGAAPWQLPPGDYDITEAKLTLVGDAPGGMWVHPAQVNFIPPKTWNNIGGGNGISAWQYFNQPLELIILKRGTKIYDVTSVVEIWFGQQPTANHGFVFIGTDGGDNEFNGSNAALSIKCNLVEGDCNMDQVIDEQDVAICEAHQNEAGGFAHGDNNLDGFIDEIDLDFYGPGT